MLFDRAVATARRYREYATKSGVPELWIAAIEAEIAERIELLTL